MQSTRLAAELGCAFDAEGTVQTDENESTDVPGLFAAGDASRQAQLAMVAAAEGAQAADQHRPSAREETCGERSAAAGG